VNDKTPWPRESQKLSKNDVGDDHWWCIGWLRPPTWDDFRWRLYIDGYKRAGDMIVKCIEDTSSVMSSKDADYAACPVAFLYWQCIELLLKLVIRTGKELLGEEGDFKYHHNITDLWNSCKTILEEVWPNGPREDLNRIEKLIGELSRHGYDSSAHRFPEDTKGNCSLPDLEYIDLKGLSNLVDEIFSFLRQVNDAISANLEAKREMDQYYRGEYY